MKIIQTKNFIGVLAKIMPDIREFSVGKDIVNIETVLHDKTSYNRAVASDGYCSIRIWYWEEEHPS